jgi:hypothetical protein
MATDVYANGMDIACKAGDAKVVAAFPDVCLSPPSPPAGPIPIPYPNSSFSRDMQNGSTKVTIGGQPVMCNPSTNDVLKMPRGSGGQERWYASGLVDLG